MMNQRYRVVGDCGVDYAWVIDWQRYEQLSWFQRWWNPTQASVWAGPRKDARLQCEHLNLEENGV